MNMAAKKVMLLFLFVGVSTATSAQVVEEEEVMMEETVEVRDLLNPSKEKGIKVFGNYGEKGIKDFDTGEILLPAKYYSVYQKGEIFEVTARNENSEKPMGVFDSRVKKMVIPVEYDEVFVKTRSLKESKEYYFILKSKGKYEILGPDYKPLISDRYDHIRFENDFIVIKSGEKYGVYVIASKKQTPIVYDGVHNYLRGGRLHDNILAIKGDEKYLFDEQGKVVINKSKYFHSVPRQWDPDYKRELFVVSDPKGRRLDVFDTKQMKKVIVGSYSAIPQAFQDHFIVKKKGKFGLITADNNVKIPFEYDTIEFLAPPNTLTNKNVERGYVDAKRLPYPFLLAKKNGMYGLINEKNEVITPFEYLRISHLYGAYKAYKATGFELLDVDGKPTTGEVYDNIGQCFNNKCAVFKGGKIAYLNMKGELLEPFERSAEVYGYDQIQLLFEKYAEALKSEDDSVLMKFTKAVTPDAYSIEFLKRVSFGYRGIPDQLGQQSITLEQIVENNFRRFSNFRRKLKRRGHLKGLQFIKVDRPSYIYHDFGRYKFLVNETYGVYMSGDKQYRYKLGELINVDGYWKSFTEPRRL